MKCNCFVCGKEFERKPAAIKRAKRPVCSRACADVLKQRETVEIPCCVCGKPLLRRKSRLEIRPNPVCSKSCKTVLQHRLFYNENIPQEQRETDRNYFPENRQFIKSVMARDNFTCVLCGQVGGKLAVHHLNGYHWDVGNRYNTDNGVTLCEKCHKGFHHEYGLGNNTKEQFNEYANQNRRLFEE